MTVTEIEVAGSGEGPYGVAVHDGDVWVTLVHAGAVVRVRHGAVERHDLGAVDARPSVVLADTDGAAWFTCSGDHSIRRIDAAGTVSTFALPSGSPYGLCTGPDGLWFTVMDEDRIGRLDATGEVTLVDVGRPACFPAMITSRGDEVWFTLNAAGAIGQRSGDATRIHELPTAAAGPVGISAGPAGVWFAELLAGQLGRIDTDGRITEFPLPDRSSKPHAVVATADGGCWATLWGTGELVRVDADGTVVGEFALGASSEPHGLAVDDDGSVWVALESGSLVHVTSRSG